MARVDITKSAISLPDSQQTVVRVSMSEWDSGLPSSIPTSIPTGSIKGNSWNPARMFSRKPSVKSTGPNRSRFSSWGSAKVPHAAAVSTRTSSQSIKIFADVENLSSSSDGRHSEEKAMDLNTGEELVDPNLVLLDVRPTKTMAIPNPISPVSPPAVRLLQNAHYNEPRRAPGNSDRASNENIMGLFRAFPAPPLRPNVVNFQYPLRSDRFRILPPSSAGSASVRGHKRMASVDKLLPEPPYHSFDLRKKRIVVGLVSLASMLSPLSTSIYFPALNAIAMEFHISWAIVLLTITVYMIPQAIAPFLWMPFCEGLGRRPVFIGLLAVFQGANIGLIFTKGLAPFMVLRAVQAAGAAPLTSVAVSVIGDISTGKERASLIGIFSAVLMFSHFISPVIGGALTQWLGFRLIFCFLLICSTAAMILTLIILPETLRSMAGNGTIRLKWYQRPLVDVFTSRTATPFKSHRAAEIAKPIIQNFSEPFHGIFRLDIIASIFFGSMVYAVLIIVIATTALLFQAHFQLSTVLVGVAFLPAGIGSIISYFLVNWLMDRDYRIVENRYKRKERLPMEKSVNPKLTPDFPVERARLRNIRPFVLTFVGITAGYGFTLSTHHIVLPLVFQFLISASATAILLLNGVLIADLYPGDCASVGAVMNLVRFFMGALAVGVVQLVFDRIGVPLTFLILGLAMLAFTPILIMQWFYGTKSRVGRQVASEQSTGVRSFMERGTSGIRELPGRIKDWSNRMAERVGRKLRF